MSSTTLSYPVQLNVTEDLQVTVIPHDMHEWVISSAQLAKAYGVDRGTIRKNQSTHQSEIIEGVHFIKGVTSSNTLSNQQKQTYFTKAGVIRLGFYLRSERAKMFRDWAEKVILTLTAPTAVAPAITEPASSLSFTQALGPASSSIQA